MMEPWRAYQEEAAAYFRSVGLSAETDVSLIGVRTRHSVDVAVRFRSAGMEHLWVVECKHHARRVSKDRVLALRAIVDDLGADRGVLLAENGFQSGAEEAATSTNVLVTSLDKLRAASVDEILQLELRQLADRVETAQEALHARGTRDRRVAGLAFITPQPPKEVWPTGHIGLVSSLAVLKDGIKQARAGRYPAVYAWHDDGNQLLRADRDEYVARASSLLARIEQVVDALPYLGRDG